MHPVRLARISLAILLAHRTRTLLACASVFIGVAALVLVVGAGQAARRDLQSRIREMGSNILAVRAGRFEQFGRRVQQISRTHLLVPQDAVAIKREVPGVQRVSGLAIGRKQVRWQSNWQVFPVVGVNPDFFELHRVRLTAGRTFSAEEERGLARVVVVGARAARELFELENPLGQRVRIGRVLFEVIGVAAEKGVSLSGTDPDRSLYVPLATQLTRVLGRTWLDAVVVQAPSSTALPAVRREIEAILRRNHRLPEGRLEDFAIQQPAALLATEHEMGETFRASVGAVAVISLATGGIGIVAVMLLAVRERTREIGLRRAIGATRPGIFLQFLFEAALLGGLGGLAGALVAVPTSALMCRLAAWPVVWPWTAALGGFAFSAGLGVLCGVAPALRAAHLEPAIAVRAAG